jgi:PAS domain S-box-containing protein
VPIEDTEITMEERADITRAKQEWEQTFDSVSEMIFIVDRDFTIVRANRAMARRCGLTPIQVVGRKCFDVIHDFAYCSPNCPHSSMLDSYEPQTFEFETKKMRGTFEMTVSPMLNAEGRVTASVHVARDVTEKRRIEKDLQESEQRFSLFMWHLPLAVSIKDEHGRFLFANEYMKDLFRVEDLVGLTTRDLLSTDAAMKIAENDQDALSQGLGLYNDVIIDLDGNELVLDSYKFSIPQSDGTTLLGTISMDVTEKRRHEEMLAVHQQQLEEINSTLEYRIEKAVNELRKKDDLLIQQSRLTAMGEMMSNIAHRWRQPLNNIGITVQGLQLAFKSNDLSVEELDEDIADTMRDLQQLSCVIDDFRNFFSYEEEAGPMSINELVSRALSFVGPTLKSKGIKIVLNGQSDVTSEGYSNEYVQALLNVILNARDALLDSQVEYPLISIEIHEENGRSTVIVQDNGGGIREDVLPKIFDPYFTTKHQDKGSGIGLYMAKMIIEKKMNGRLTARNVSGGAEFRIEV